MLKQENSTKSKTKHIHFLEFKMRDYLSKNENRKLSQIIFAVRSQTLDIKVWQQWNYSDNACVACQKNEENMSHFMTCMSYENCISEIDWKIIFENDPSKQFEIARIVQKRMIKRYEILETERAGLTLDSGSTAPGNC